MEFKEKLQKNLNKKTRYGWLDKLESYHRLPNDMKTAITSLLIPGIFLQQDELFLDYEDARDIIVAFIESIESAKQQPCDDKKAQSSSSFKKKEKKKTKAKAAEIATPAAAPAAPATPPARKAPEPTSPAPGTETAPPEPEPLPLQDQAAKDQAGIDSWIRSQLKDALANDDSDSVDWGALVKHCHEHSLFQKHVIKIEEEVGDDSWTFGHEDGDMMADLECFLDFIILASHMDKPADPAETAVATEAVGIQTVKAAEEAAAATGQVEAAAEAAEVEAAAEAKAKEAELQITQITRTTEITEATATTTAAATGEVDEETAEKIESQSKPELQTITVPKDKAAEATEEPGEAAEEPGVEAKKAESEPELQLQATADNGNDNDQKGELSGQPPPPPPVGNVELPDTGGKDKASESQADAAAKAAAASVGDDYAGLDQEGLAKELERLQMEAPKKFLSTDERVARDQKSEKLRQQSDIVTAALATAEPAADPQVQEEEEADAEADGDSEDQNQEDAEEEELENHQDQEQEESEKEDAEHDTYVDEDSSTATVWIYAMLLFLYIIL